MACGPCARRRKALAAKLKQKQVQGKHMQAAALGAVLAVSEAAGKVIGIHGEVEDADDQATTRSLSGEASGSTSASNAKGAGDV